MIDNILRNALNILLQSHGVPVEVISYHQTHSSIKITLATYARMSAAQEGSKFDSLNIRLRG